jgi:hypothetical protein
MYWHIPEGGGAARGEEEWIRGLITKEAEERGFPAFDLDFHEDSTGFPAVWISFLLDPDYPLDRAPINALIEVGDAVKSVLFKHEIQRVPYVRFRDKPKAVHYSGCRTDFLMPLSTNPRSQS